MGVLVCGGQKKAVIDGTVNMNVKDADLVLVSGGQKMAVIDGTVNMNVKDADLVLGSGGQKMAVMDGTVNINVIGGQKMAVIDGIVKMNVQRQHLMRLCLSHDTSSPDMCSVHFHVDIVVLTNPLMTWTSTATIHLT